MSCGRAKLVRLVIGSIALGELATAWDLAAFAGVPGFKLFEVIPPAGATPLAGAAEAPFMSVAGTRPPAGVMPLDGWFVIAGLLPFGDGGVVESAAVREPWAVGCRFQPEAFAAAVEAAGWPTVGVVFVRVERAALGRV
jgi:hypothetical protein